jgi:hypothetical protein
MHSLILFTIGGSGFTKEEIGIEMTDLSYTFAYENPNTETYKKLKRDIEAAVRLL